MRTWLHFTGEDLLLVLTALKENIWRIGIVECSVDVYWRARGDIGNYIGSLSIERDRDERVDGGDWTVI